MNNKKFMQKIISMYISFYEGLFNISFPYIHYGPPSLLNPDAFMFASIRETLQSIQILIQKSRYADTYTLLRKYYDLIIIQTYINIYLKEGSEDIFEYHNRMEQINNWIKNKKQLPLPRETQNLKKSDFSKRVEFLYHHKLLRPLQRILKSYQNEFKNIRDRCNDYIHYNYFITILANGENSLTIEKEKEFLSQFMDDLRMLFILHFTYLFLITPQYMRSSDYVDYLEAGKEPPNGSEYWIAPFVRNIIDKELKPHAPGFFRIIKENTSMRIE